MNPYTFYGAILSVFGICLISTASGLRCHDCKRISELKSKDFQDCETGVCKGDYCLLNKTRLFKPDFTFDSIVTRTCIDKKRADDYFKSGVTNNKCLNWEVFSQTCVCNNEDFCSDARVTYSTLFVPVTLALTFLQLL
uniref:Protein quiver n=1 Tax=Romanomermis culicivorax TaxID=13658 RepID=A0A915J3N1_ROMCU